MKTRVVAFGSFDILHPGHLEYLRAASKLGDELVVVIARDDSVHFFKNMKPVMRQEARAALVGSLKFVDKAVIGEKLRKPSDVYNVFLRYRPSVIALGYDQRADIQEMRVWLARHHMKPRIVRIKKKLDERWYKSSKIKRRIVDSLS